MDAATPPSGIPYLAYLSGLNLGQGGQSGVTDPSLSGQPAQAKGGAGMAGGLGLDELSQLLAAQQASDIIGAGTGQSLQTGIGSLGGFGGLGQGSGYGQAGGVLSQGAQQGPQQGTGIAGQTGGGIDPMAILKQALGFLKAGAGLLPNGQGGYQNIGDTGGVSLSDQLRSGQSGIASPTVNALGQFVNSINAGGGLSDTLRGIPSGTATVGQPQILETSGQTPDITLLNQIAPGGAGAIPPSLAALGVTPDNLPQFMSAMSTLPPEAVSQFQAELGMGGATAPQQGGSYATALPPSGTNLSGIASGGIGAGTGLLQILQSILGQGTDTSKALGATSGALGAAQGGATLSDALGATSGLAGDLGSIAGPLGLALQAAGILTSGSGDRATMSAIQEAEGNQVAESSLAAMAPILLGLTENPIGAFAAPVLGVAMAIQQALNPQTNYLINKQAGKYGPMISQNLENVAGLTPQGTDLSQLPTSILEQLIPRQLGALGQYYNQDIPEAHYLTGLQAEQSPELGAVQQALGTTKTSLLQEIADLQQRGVGNDIIGNFMSPQRSAQMYNTDWAGVPGYQSPAALMQAQGLASNEALAGVYGGPTWLALNQLFGPGLSDTLSQYGITAPAMNLPQPTGDLAAANAASQYNPSLPATPEQIASQYGGGLPWLG